jgi:hypothetical protein
MQSGTGKIKDPDNGWSDDVENVLESIRHNASVLSNHHKKNYTYYNGQLKYYKIPVIIISGLNSVTAVGLQPYIDQQHISVTNCLLALLCGIIGSIELFLGISSGAEAELKSSKDFYLLSIDIYLTLTLDRERRPPAKTYLDHKYSEYADLFRGSALIQKKIIDKLSTVELVRTKKSSVLDEPLGTRSSPSDFRSRMFGNAFRGVTPPQPLELASRALTDVAIDIVDDTSRELTRQLRVPINDGRKIANDVSRELVSQLEVPINDGRRIVDDAVSEDVDTELASILDDSV